MGRLILVIIIGLAAGLYFPDTRAVILDKAKPVLRPWLEWQAQREMEQIAKAIQDMEEEQHKIPDHREYLKFLESNFTADVKTDPWGSVYGYEVKPDSFAIVSDGPDKTSKTADDIRDVRVRNWKAKGRGNP